MKKLDESFLDDIDIASDGGTDSLLVLGDSKPKKKKKSKLELPIQQLKPQQQPQAVVSTITGTGSGIVMPQSLSDMQHNSIVDSIVAKQVSVQKQQQTTQTKEVVKRVLKPRKKKIEQIVNQKIQIQESTVGLLSPIQKEEIRQQVIIEEQITEEQVQQVKEVFGPLENVNVPELVENLGDALEEIPGEDIELSDISIVPSKIKKDKTGYFKTKVTIKTSNIPDIINKIASYIKQQSNGMIKPRVCDLRVIGNTNKTQLRNSQLKLSCATVVFKPDTNKLKVNKGTRFMISVPEDHSTTGNLLVYLQESRAKTIMELTPRDFPNVETFCEFIGDRIAEYYYHGYDVTLKKLQLRNTNNVLMPVISQILNTRDYKAKPYTDADNLLFAVDFISKNDENQWLTIQVRETGELGMYEIIGLNTVTNDEYTLINQNVSIGWMLKNLYNTLNSTYARDWSDVLKAEDGLDENYYMLGKLKHYKLRKVLIDMFKIQEDNSAIGLTIQKTASKKDMVKLQNKDYDAEAIIGKTNSLDFFILTYLAYSIIGGDARKGRQYITNEEYYNKYSVSDRRQYQKRDKTVIKKEGAERNYNARPYMFQLEFRVKGVTTIYRSKDFNDVLEKTKFLTQNPDVTIKSQY